MQTDYNNDHSIAKSWLLTLLSIVFNMTLNDVATMFVIISAGVSSGYTLWKWRKGIKNEKDS